MDPQSQERVARNEVLFRQANEGIRRGIWPDERGRTVPFRCECSRFDCNQPVNVTVEAYELVRRDPLHFIVVGGHEVPEAEVVVERHPGYVVVEKQDVGAATAEAHDPRA